MKERHFLISLMYVDKDSLYFGKIPYTKIDYTILRRCIRIGLATRFYLCLSSVVYSICVVIVQDTKLLIFKRVLG
jgi:hypothetical protein